METTLLPLLSTCFLLATVLSSASPPLLLGVHPLDEKYFASEVIKCKDGSKAFDRARLNDNYCDCPDGTDEPGNGPEIRSANSIPTESNKVAEERKQFGQFGIVLDASLLQGTSACPTGKFYCKNFGSMPKFIFSSCVNDRICDCCDGSDEYDGSIRCPNTCIMGGNLAYKSGDTTSFGTINEHSTVSDLENMYAKETKSRIKLDDLIQKLIGLKAVIILQLFVISCVVAFRIFLRRAKSRRRRYH